MIYKILALCMVLFAGGVFGGIVKTKVPAEVEEVITEIDVTGLLLEREVKRAIIEEKHDYDAAKIEIKTAAKQVKTAIKAAKGTVCGQIASVEAKSLESLAANAKACSQSLDLKELEHDTSTILKNLHMDALLIDHYCRFANPDEEVEVIDACITNSVGLIRKGLAKVETTLKTGLAARDNTSEECYKKVTDEVHAKAETIQSDLSECLNPSTAPASTTTEVTAETTETPGLSESTDNDSKEPELETTVKEGTNEDISTKNDSAVSNDQEVTPELSTPEAPVVSTGYVKKEEKSQDEDEINVEY